MLFLVGNERFVVLYYSPLERGLRGVLWRDARIGLRSFLGGVSWLRVDVFDLGSCARA